MPKKPVEIDEPPMPDEVARYLGPKRPYEGRREAQALDVDALPVATEADWADLPVELYERRLVNPDMTGTEPVKLTTPGDWYCRWINTDLPGRWDQVVHRMGYRPVHMSELADVRAVTGVVASPEGYVTRGDRGKEILVKMPQAWWDKIQGAKTERRLAQQRSGEKAREDLTQAVAARFGDQAGDAVTKWRTNVVPGRERVDGALE